jgi:hypothetical protein
LLNLAPQCFGKRGVIRRDKNTNCNFFHN